MCGGSSVVPTETAGRLDCRDAAKMSSSGDTVEDINGSAAGLAPRGSIYLQAPDTAHTTAWWRSASRAVVPRRVVRGPLSRLPLLRGGYCGKRTSSPKIQPLRDLGLFRYLRPTPSKDSVRSTRWLHVGTQLFPSWSNGGGGARAAILDGETMFPCLFFSCRNRPARLSR